MQQGDILDLLEAADWSDIIFRLTNHALWRTRRYKWISGRPELLPGGMTPEDLALTAVLKVWDGTRDWNPVKYPNLLTHLMWIVDSDIDHLYRSTEHRKTVRMPETEDKGEIEVPDSQAVEAGKILSPEDELIAKEERDFEEKLKEELNNSVKGDEDLEFLLLCLEDGTDRPAEIAQITGWAISKVYNLKRKLYRKAAKLGNAFSNKN
ncbi:MAG: hypothetical protein FJ135_01390 [Deltaproteobacteria bacterium]|nr:hypothetical protein [Deltaproteobacteria bacterium]